MIVPGGFGVRGTEGKILAAEWARINKKPFLGKEVDQLLLIDHCLTGADMNNV